MACFKINESISVSYDMFGVVHNLHGQICQIFNSQKVSSKLWNDFLEAQYEYFDEIFS